jgi:hypothetical protein
MGGVNFHTADRFDESYDPPPVVRRFKVVTCPYESDNYLALCHAVGGTDAAVESDRETVVRMLMPRPEDSVFYAMLSPEGTDANVDGDGVYWREVNHERQEMVEVIDTTGCGDGTYNGRICAGPGSDIDPATSVSVSEASSSGGEDVILRNLSEDPLLAQDGQPSHLLAGGDIVLARFVYMNADGVRVFQVADRTRELMVYDLENDTGVMPAKRIEVDGTAITLLGVGSTASLIHRYSPGYNNAYPAYEADFELAGGGTGTVYFDVWGHGALTA